MPVSSREADGGGLADTWHAGRPQTVLHLDRSCSLSLAKKNKKERGKKEKTTSRHLTAGMCATYSFMLNMFPFWRSLVCEVDGRHAAPVPFMSHFPRLHLLPTGDLTSGGWKIEKIILVNIAPFLVFYPVISSQGFGGPSQRSLATPWTRLSRSRRVQTPSSIHQYT